MNKVIISKEINPYYNLALEEDMLYSVKENDVILYIWQNEKTVVIGRNQNPWLECNLEYLKSEKIHLARRISGGGAVFHDLGNVNFTFISKKSHSNLNKQLGVLKEAINSFGIEIEFSGRNDLLAKGRKFSGHAFYEDEDYYFHHGTLMVDVNLEYLTKVLTPSKEKIKSKGIESVRSRVINLKEVNSYINFEVLKDGLINAFGDIYGTIDNIKTVSKEVYVPKKIIKYQDEKWIYGETPRFDIFIEEGTKNGHIQAAFLVENGIIYEGSIYGDTLKEIPTEAIKSKIIGRYMDEKEIRNILVEFLNETD